MRYSDIVRTAKERAEDIDYLNDAALHYAYRPYSKMFVATTTALYRAVVFKD